MVSGAPEIWVRPFPGTAPSKWKVSPNGGRFPLWSEDGRELFYLSEAGMLTVVAVESQSGFAIGPPEDLFPVQDYESATNSRPYDLSRTSNRFIFHKLSSSVTPTIAMTTNWFEDVAARVGL